MGFASVRMPSEANLKAIDMVSGGHALRASREEGEMAWVRRGSLDGKSASRRRRVGHAFSFDDSFDARSLSTS